MSDGIYSALSGAIAQQRNLDVVANNVANANTVGYHADRVAFSQALTAAAPNPEAPDAIRYVALTRVQQDLSAGSLETTNNPLDVAIQGAGYFAIQTPAGERYTRAGNFSTDAEGLLRTHDGHPVLSMANTEIRIPLDAREIFVSDDGTISANGEAMGRLKIVRFEDPRAALTKEGQTFFRLSGSEAPVEALDGQVVQGHVEMSNVNAVNGMNELITVTRSFEAFQKVIQVFREMDQRAARDIGSRG